VKYNNNDQNYEQHEFKAPDYRFNEQTNTQNLDKFINNTSTDNDVKNQPLNQNHNQTQDANDIDIDADALEPKNKESNNSPTQVNVQQPSRPNNSNDETENLR